MKKPYLILILVVFINLSWSSTYQPSVYYKLTDQDRKNYILNIDQKKIKAPHDTIIYKTKYNLAYVTVKLSNYSKDTLKYMIMSCSWYDQFQVNNKKLTIFGWPCDGNFPVERIIIPHKSASFGVPIIVTKGSSKTETFKIAMNLFMGNKKNQDFLFESPDKYKAVNLIWSNEVELP
ncbi:MAG TPA: hypothetical protein VGI43_02485 [Mucilaginibacter sp.]|jgi:hypothetical protein